MALPFTFGPLTAAQLAQLDQDFAAVGALGTQQCSATGTNSIVLTPAANQPALSGYGLPNPVKFGFAAAATSSGNVTLEVSSFGFLPVFTPNGIQATTETLTSGNYYEVTYSTAALYNSGNGAWVLTSFQPGTGLTVLAGASALGLKIINDSVTPNTKIDISFQQACLVSATGTPTFLGILSAVIDLTTGTVTSTANGMDGESRPASGWVYIYAISTGSGLSGLGTTVSPLAGPPTLPAGFAFYAYLGAMFCDSSSNLKRSQQLGENAQYLVTPTTNTAALPTVASGSQGTISGATFTGVSNSVTAIVPPTTSRFRFVLSLAGPGGSSSVGVAPNTNYNGTATANPIPWNIIVPASGTQVLPGEFILESSAVFFAASNGGLMQGIGWTDYVSAAG